MVGVYYTPVLILFFANTMVLADSSEESFACEALFNDTNRSLQNVYNENAKLTDMKCCNSEVLKDDTSESTNCKNFKDGEEFTCEDYKCLLKEDDLLFGDQFSEDKANEKFDAWEKDYPKEKPMIDRARRECLGGKYLEYIDEENCGPLKFYLCLYMNVIVECQSWKKDPQCTKMKEYAEKCKEFQDSK